MADRRDFMLQTAHMYHTVKPVYKDHAYKYQKWSLLTGSHCILFSDRTVKPALKTNCIRRPPASMDYFKTPKGGLHRQV